MPDSGHEKNQNRSPHTVTEVKKEISSFSERRTREDSILLETLQPGDMITLRFFARPDTLKDYPSLYLQVTESATNESNLEAIAAGGRNGWNNTRVRVTGSTPTPFSPVIHPNQIVATRYLEFEYYDEEVAKRQKSGGQLLETPLGSMTAEKFRQIITKEFPEMSAEDINRLLDEQYFGWTITYSPQIADFELDISHRAKRK